jgi:hypothetical protein
MSEVKAKGGLKFVSHRPTDKTDPGFRIVGHKLRWVAANATEDKMGRFWRVIRKHELPEDFLKAMKEANREMFGQDSTIRNRELVLAYAPDEVVGQAREELRQAAKSQLSRVTSRAAPNKHMRVEEAELSHESSSDFFEK